MLWELSELFVLWKVLAPRIRLCWVLTADSLKAHIQGNVGKIPALCREAVGSKACWQNCWRRVANCKAGSPEQSKLLISHTANCPHRNLLQSWLDLMTLTDSETETELGGVLLNGGGLLQEHNTNLNSKTVAVSSALDIQGLDTRYMSPRKSQERYQILRGMMYISQERLTAITCNRQI